MEKDETVSDSSPHIANIGRLVEVSVVKLSQLEPAAGSHLCIWSYAKELCCTLTFVLTNYLYCTKSNDVNVAQCLTAQHSS